MRINNKYIQVGFMGKLAYRHMGTLVCCLAILPAMTACTEGSMDYRGNEGTVTITPIWTSANLPAEVKYYFYPASGGSPTQVTTDARQVETILPTGTYRVLAYNTDAVGVTHKNQESHQTAMAELLPQKVSRAVSYIGQPEKVYSLYLEQIEVPYQSSVSRQVDAMSHCRNLILEFLFDGTGQVTTLSGSMTGIYNSILLAGGDPTYQAVQNSAHTAIDFTTTLSENTGTAGVRVLGLHNPQNGQQYRSLMEITVTLSDGQRKKTTLDLSGTLTQVLETNGGKLPVEVPVNIQIRVKDISTELSASVTGWSQGNGSGDI